MRDSCRGNESLVQLFEQLEVEKQYPAALCSAQ